MTVLQNFVLEHIDSTAKIIKSAIVTQHLDRRRIANMEKYPSTEQHRLDHLYAELNDAETISDRLSDCLELLMCSYLEVYGTREFVKPIADTGILTEDQINEICDDKLAEGKTESVREFRERIEKEGYSLICISGGNIIRKPEHRLYRIVTPDNRIFDGTIQEVKDFIGE